MFLLLRNMLVQQKYTRYILKAITVINASNEIGQETYAKKGSDCSAREQ